MKFVCNQYELHTHLAKVMRPTLFSGFCLVFEWQTKLTASCCAWSLVGRKSPFLIHSLLSTLYKKSNYNQVLKYHSINIISHGKLVKNLTIQPWIPKPSWFIKLCITFSLTWLDNFLLDFQLMLSVRCCWPFANKIGWSAAFHLLCLLTQVFKASMELSRLRNCLFSLSRQTKQTFQSWKSSSKKLEIISTIQKCLIAF